MTPLMSTSRATRSRLLMAAAATAILMPVAAQADTLNQMLSAAYLFSPTLKSARYSLDAVNEQRPQALSSWLPTVSLTGTAYPNQTTQPKFVGPGSRYDQLSNTTSLTLPITQGGGEFARLHGAEHNILAARASLLSTEQTVLYTAVTAYADVLTDRAIVKAETENLDALRQMLATVTQQVQAGERTIPEQTLTRLRVSDAEATLIDGRSQVVQAESRYYQVAGVLPGPSLPDPAPLTMLPPTLDDARVLALSSNPTVRSSIYVALSARDSVDQAIATLLPSLSFVVSDERYRQNWPSDTKYLNGSYSSTYFGLQLSVPIYQGGAEYAAVRIAKKNALAREKDRDASSLDAVSSTEQAWAARSAAAGQVQQYQDTLHVAGQLVEEYRREVAAGEITAFEALDGFASRLTAQVSLYSAVRNRILADYGLLLAVGGLTARTLALDVPYYDPAGDYQRTKWRIWGLGVE
jgi:outer membrane protein